MQLYNIVYIIGLTISNLPTISPEYIPIFRGRNCARLSSKPGLERPQEISGVVMGVPKSSKIHQNWTILYYFTIEYY